MNSEEQVSGPETTVEKPKNDFVVHGEEETNAEPAPEEEAPAEESTTDEESSQDKPNEEGKKPKRGGFQKKIGRLEAERDFYRLELERARSGAPVENKPSAKSDNASAPKETDFETFADYNQAVISYHVQEGIKKAQAESGIQQEFKSKVDRYNQLTAEFKKETPDFDEAINNSDIKMTEPLRVALLESDMGPEVAYYLANNPDEAEEILGMGVVALNKRIAKIEAKIEFSKSSPKIAAKTTKAPAPITPVGNGKGNVGPTNVEDMSFEDYKAARRAGRI